MAGKGLTIPLSLDPREWLRGIKVVERSLETFEDSLEEVEDAGKQLGRKLEDVFDEAARDARRSGDQMETGLSEGLESGLRDGNLRTVAGAAAGEIVDEFVENWGEAVSSGDDAGAVRETLSQQGQVGGAIGGPAGAVIGGALALGLTQAFDSITNNRLITAVRESFDDLADEAISAGQEAGTNFVQEFYKAQDTEEARRGALTSFFDTETPLEGMEELIRLAGELQTSEQLVFDAVTGTNAQRQIAVGQLEEERDRVQEQLDYQIDLNVRDDVGNRLNQDKIDKLNEQKRKYDDLLADVGVILTETGDTVTNLEAYQRALNNAGGKVDTLKQKLREADAEAGTLLGTFQEAGRTVISVRVNADTTAFYSSVRDAMQWAARGTNVPI